ncbi:phosphotransferase [Psychromonas hadalis]|uniref:phosphotransferase n=1 Tax=Psychromonas hadalis TaxID=211669 RepID=UPI0003B355B0|nr:phosphotransferase [Psychromonas hadalis]
MLSKTELAWLTENNVAHITRVEQFKHALTNEVFLITVNKSNSFIFKRLNQQARSSDDRQAEFLVQQLASLQGLTPKVLAHSKAYKLQQYIEGDLIPTNSDNLSAFLATQLHRIHQLPALYGPTQRLVFELNRLKKQLHFAIDKSIFAAMLILAKQLDSDCACDTLCHGDLSLNNILQGDDKLIYLLDWEYAVIACPAYDLAFCNCINGFTERQCEQLIEHYYLQISHQPNYTLKSLQKECVLYLKLFDYINELWSLCFVEKN